MFSRISGNAHLLRLIWIVIPSGVLLLAYSSLFYRLRQSTCSSSLWFPSDFDGFDNESGIQSGKFIVPNYVHFLRFGKDHFSFPEMVCVLAAFKNHRPDKIFFHTDVSQFQGEYWERLLVVPGLKEILEIRNISLPGTIFGQSFDVLYHKWHASDIVRINILMKYGGIFLDNDSFIVRNLDFFRRFEMSLGWPNGSFMGTQVLIAHKDARFLKLWLESYQEYYPRLWYYNAGGKPTKEILEVRPELVHRVEKLFGVHDLTEELYKIGDWKQWRNQYAVHLLANHRYRVDTFNYYFGKYRDFTLENIVHYPMTFGEMARDVLRILYM